MHPELVPTTHPGILLAPACDGSDPVARAIDELDSAARAGNRNTPAPSFVASSPIQMPNDVNNLNDDTKSAYPDKRGTAREAYR